MWEIDEYKKLHRTHQLNSIDIEISKGHTGGRDRESESERDLFFMADSQFVNCC